MLLEPLDRAESTLRQEARSLLAGGIARQREHITWAFGAGLLTHAVFFWSAWEGAPVRITASGAIGASRRFSATTAGIQLATTDGTALMTIRWPDVHKLMHTVPSWRKDWERSDIALHGYLRNQLHYARDHRYGFAADTERAAKAEREWAEHQQHCRATAAQLWLLIRPQSPLQPGLF